MNGREKCTGLRIPCTRSRKAIFAALGERDPEAEISQ